MCNSYRNCTCGTDRQQREQPAYEVFGNHVPVDDGFPMDAYRDADRNYLANLKAASGG